MEKPFERPKRCCADASPLRFFKSATCDSPIICDFSPNPLLRQGTEMKRHTITVGASTSVGGKVISASSTGRIHGKEIALEGDMVSCPACKSQGKIICVGPRIPETWNGRNVALENDLCVCGCPTPPRLIPCQFFRFQSVGNGSTDASHSAARSGIGNLTFNDKYVLLDADTDKPLSNAEYAIRRANGQIEFGVTDEHGNTHLLATTVHAESVDIYC